MTIFKSESRREAILGASLLLTIFASLVLSEVVARISQASSEVADPRSQRRFQRIGTLDGDALSKLDRTARASVEGRPFALFIGNSHSYSTPQTKPVLFGYKQFTPSSGLIVDHAAEAVWDVMGQDAMFFGIQEPAITTAEMLLWVAGFEANGIIPSAVVIGATYLNFRGEPSIRETDAELLLDTRLFDKFISALKTDPEKATFEIERLTARRNTLLKERSTPGSQGLVDRFENILWAKLDGISAFSANRAEIRTFTMFVLSFFSGSLSAQKIQKTVSRDQLSYERNLFYFQILLSKFKKSGTNVFIYIVPDRKDLPSRWPPSETEEWVAWLKDIAGKNDYPIADWRDAIPESRYWGYFGRGYDYAHFLVPGHKILGDMLRPRLNEYLLAARSKGVAR